jgi:carbamoyltransferase
MKILGISNNLGASASLIINGKLIFVIHEERLNRNKDFRGLPEKSIKYIFSKYGLSFKSIDLVTYGVANNIRDSSIDESINNLKKKYKDKKIKEIIDHRYKSERKWIKKHINEIKNFAKKNNFLKKLKFQDHHLSHAAGALFTSPFLDAFVFTADGKGDFLSSTCYSYYNNKLELLSSNSTFNSLGYFYSNVTFALGFKPEKHEGKITGLAAYGKKTKLIEYFETFIKFNKNKFSFIIGDDYQPFFCEEKHIPNFYKKIKQYSKEDVSYAAQYILEKYIMKWIKNLLPKNKKNNICLSGGIFANVKLNQKINEMKNVKNVYIHPAMGDQGLSVGSSYAELSQIKKIKPKFLSSVALGNSYSNNELKLFLDNNKIKYTYMHNIALEMHKELSKNRPIGFFSRRMEYGPRALLNRSIIYHAKDKKVNIWLNKRLNRSEFMPFAPVTIEDKAKDCFKGWKSNQFAADFMTITYKCNKNFIKKCPAAVHVDQTARPQIIRKTNNLKHYNILKQFFKISGEIAILNTSFNNHEEPIVCTPRDAIESLNRRNIDVLFLENFKIYGKDIS